MSFSPVDDPLIIATDASPRGWHRLQLAAECLQKYAWSEEMPGPKEDEMTSSPALQIGSLIHLALAHHYARMMQEQAGLNPEEYMESCEVVRLIAESKGLKRHIANVTSTYRAYKRHYFGDIRNLTVLAVETLFDDRIKGYRLTGRIDLAYEDLGGQIFVCDHKSSGRLTAKQKEYYSISGQLLGYQYLARKKYPTMSGMILNMVQHTKPKFERVALPRSVALERQFVDRVVDIEEAVARIKAQNRPVDEWPKAMSELTCITRYGACKFIDKCRHGMNSKKAGDWSWEED